MECVAGFVFWADCDICLRQFASLVNRVSTHKANTVLSLWTRAIVLCCDQQWRPVCFWRARRCFRAFVLYSTRNLTACYAHVLIFCALGGDINVGAFYFRTQLLLVDQLAKPFWYSHVAELRLAAAHDCFAAFHHCVARQTKVGTGYDHVLRAGVLFGKSVVPNGIFRTEFPCPIPLPPQTSFSTPPPSRPAPQLSQTQRIVSFRQADILFVTQQRTVKICGH